MKETRFPLFSSKRRQETGILLYLRDINYQHGKKTEREAPSRPHKGYNLANAGGSHPHDNQTVKKFFQMSKLDKLRR